MSERERFEAFARECWMAMCLQLAIDGSRVYDHPAVDDAWLAWQAARADALEQAAKACEKRSEQRFEKHGYTEPDTNASYYVGEYRDLGDSLDEEDADCAAAIRALLLREKDNP